MPVIQPVTAGMASEAFATRFLCAPMELISPRFVPRRRYCSRASPCWRISASTAARCLPEKFFTKGSTAAMVSAPSTAPAVGRLAACAMATPGFTVRMAPA